MNQFFVQAEIFFGFQKKTKKKYQKKTGILYFTDQIPYNGLGSMRIPI